MAAEALDVVDVTEAAEAAPAAPPPQQATGPDAGFRLTAWLPALPEHLLLRTAQAAFVLLCFALAVQWIRGRVARQRRLDADRRT